MGNVEYDTHHVCPWWIGYLLIGPVRRIYHNPEKIVRQYVKPGMKILEIGPGMGFFSLPMARLVGENGRVICIDVQEKMLRALERRAKRAGLIGRIHIRLASGNSLPVNDIRGIVDFALLFAVVHEIPDREQLFQEVYASMRSQSFLLLSEPKGHVTKEDYNLTLSFARHSGFEVVTHPTIWRSYSTVLKRM